MTIRACDYRLAGLVALIFGTASGSSDARPPAQQATHWVVAADLSASRHPIHLKEAKEFVAALTRVVKNGDAVTLFRVYERGLSDTNFIWTKHIAAAPDPDRPRPSDSLALRDFESELTA